MKIPTKTEMWQLIDELRALAPKRPLTYGQSVRVARLQSERLRAWVHPGEPAINLVWFIHQQAVPVQFVPSYVIGGESGVTTDGVDGRLRTFINRGEPKLRHRFSLMHELKHILDFQDAATLHANLGCGNEKRQKDQIEFIANEFAAHVLMPAPLVQEVWFATQNIDVAAIAFDVSPEAMKTRLEKLNLIGEPLKLSRTYFRVVGTLYPTPA